jgi:hypothetical protein
MWDCVAVIRSVRATAQWLLEVQISKGRTILLNFSPAQLVALDRMSVSKSRLRRPQLRRRMCASALSNGSIALAIILGLEASSCSAMCAFSRYDRQAADPRSRRCWVVHTINHCTTTRRPEISSQLQLAHKQLQSNIERCNFKYCSIYTSNSAASREGGRAKPFRGNGTVAILT